MDEAPKKPRSLAFRIRVGILVLVGIAALTQIGRLNRYAATEGILQSHSPDPAIFHRLLQDSPDPGPLMTRIWNTGKLPHRWEIINYLNRNLGQRPELVPVIGDIVRQAANDPDLTLRVTALNLLRVIDHPESRMVASAALNDPDPLVQDIARVLLQKAGATVELSAQPANEESQLRGPSFGHLAFLDFKQQPYSLSQYSGRPVLLHFFATWSLDCVKEIPALVELRELAPPELAIVGINVDGVPGVLHDHSTGDHDHDHDHEECKPDCNGASCGAVCQGVSTELIKAVERHVIVNGYNFPIVFDTDGLATAQLEGSELPVHVLLDKDHRLLRRYAGIRSAQVHDQIVRSLLGFKMTPVVTNQLTTNQMNLIPSAL